MGKCRIMKAYSTSLCRISSWGATEKYCTEPSSALHSWDSYIPEEPNAVYLCSGTTSPSDCQDLYANCQSMTQFCTVSGTQAMMSTYCRKTCKLCSGSASNTTTAGTCSDNSRRYDKIWFIKKVVVQPIFQSFAACGSVQQRFVTEWRVLMSASGQERSSLQI